MPSHASPSQLARRWAENALDILIRSSLTGTFARGLGLLIFIAIAASTETLLSLNKQERESSQHAAAIMRASDLRARLDRELNTVLYLSSGLSSYLVVRHNNIDAVELRDILTTLHGNSRHVRNFSIAVGYRVDYVYPPRGNEKAIGLDYTKVPDQWPSVKLTVDSGRGTLTGPVNLVQGGVGFIYRSPIFIKGSYWGLLSTVINFDSFIQSGFNGIDQSDCEYAILRVQDPSQPDKIIWGDRNLFDNKNAAKLDMEVPNGKWIIAALPHTHNERSLDSGFRLMGWLLALGIGLATHSLLRQRSKLTQNAGFDKLTGLPNRRLLDDRMQQYLHHADRHAGHCLGLLFIDLDGFKSINDQYGHRFGDIALQTAALRIREEIRLSDTVARWGGDEFVALIENADVTLLDNLVERLRHRLSLPFEMDGIVLRLGASIGVVLHPIDGADPNMLLQMADKRMYEDKQQRKREDPFAESTPPF